MPLTLPLGLRLGQSGVHAHQSVRFRLANTQETLKPKKERAEKTLSSYKNADAQQIGRLMYSK